MALCMAWPQEYTTSPTIIVFVSRSEAQANAPAVTALPKSIGTTQHGGWQFMPGYIVFIMKFVWHKRAEPLRLIPAVRHVYSLTIFSMSDSIIPVILQTISIAKPFANI